MSVAGKKLLVTYILDVDCCIKRN